MLNTINHEKEVDKYLKDNNIEVMHKESWWYIEDNVVKYVTVFYGDVPVWKPLIEDVDGAYIEITDDIHYYVLFTNYDTEEQYKAAKKFFAERK